MTQQIVFRREVLIDAPLAHVWQLVATEEGLQQWWGNAIRLEEREGGRCEEWRAGRDHTTIHWQGVVTLYAPPHQLMLTLRAQAGRADTSELTTIAIGLEAAGQQTRVHVIQRAFGTVVADSIAAPREVMPNLTNTRGLPLAQLQRTPPGTLPLPAHTTHPSVSSHNAHIAQPPDALTVTWQQRLDALVAHITPHIDTE